MPASKKKINSPETPLMRQYAAIKAKHPGPCCCFGWAIYETFGEDVITASKVLDIVLTKRANGVASHVELAGFPHDALDTYLPNWCRGAPVAIATSSKTASC